MLTVPGFKTDGHIQKFDWPLQCRALTFELISKALFMTFNMQGHEGLTLSHTEKRCLCPLTLILRSSLLCVLEGRGHNMN